jgi:hypothetical protein
MTSRLAPQSPSPIGTSLVKRFGVFRTETARLYVMYERGDFRVVMIANSGASPPPGARRPCGAFTLGSAKAFFTRWRAFRLAVGVEARQCERKSPPWATSSSDIGSQRRFRRKNIQVAQSLLSTDPTDGLRILLGLVADRLAYADVSRFFLDASRAIPSSFSHRRPRRCWLILRAAEPDPFTKIAGPA